jgi:hypothetical protein
MKSPGNQKSRKSARVRKVRKSQRRLPSLKNPELQESGILADYKSQDPGK